MEAETEVVRLMVVWMMGQPISRLLPLRRNGWLEKGKKETANSDSFAGVTKGALRDESDTPEPDLEAHCKIVPKAWSK